MYIPETNADKRDPRQEDRFLVTRLLDHLNSSLEHYNKALWYNLDADRRYMLLDGFHIQVYNDNSVPIGLKSLASVIKNDLVTVAGNSMVFPVAAGFRVGRSYLIEQTETGGAEKVSLLDHYKPITPQQPYRLSVPTKGLFVEAVKGQCDSCEKVEDNTSQDWDKFKTDEPTAINALTAPTPVVTDWKAAFKDIATATLRVQDAPTAPAPGAGLSGLSDALTKGDTFRDVTGLEGNQKNAASTYKANMEAAVKIAESVKDLATQEHSIDKNEQIAGSIKTAMKNGDISNDAGKKLLEKHYNNVVDGGSTAREEAKQAADKAKTSKPSLTDSAISGASANKNVKATKTDADGNTETVEISAGTAATTTTKDTTDSDSSTGPVLAKVKDAIDPLGVGVNKLAGWAGAAAMMLNWKEGKTLPIADRMKALGSDYSAAYDKAKGIKTAMKDGLLTKMGAVAAMDTGKVKQYIDLMNAYGPLWIATDVKDGNFSDVAYIVTKIEDTEGDSNDVTLTYNLPYEGKEETMSYAKFMEAQKAKVSGDGETLLVICFKDKLNAAGGSPAAAADEEDEDADEKDSDKVLAETDIAVPLIQQTDDCSCWAAATAMMMSYKVGLPSSTVEGATQPMSLSEAVKMAGSEFVTILTGTEDKKPDGIHATDKFRFVRALGMVSEAADVCYTDASVFIKLLQDYGPVWLTCDASTDDPIFSPHARVLYKITGTDAKAADVVFYFNDPAEKEPVTMTIAAFTKSFEEVAKDDKGVRRIDQFVHFAEKGIWEKRTDWAAKIAEAKAEAAAEAAEHADALAAGFIEPPVSEMGEGYKVSGSSGSDLAAHVGIKKTAPVHESLTLAALLNSKFKPQVPAGTRPPTIARTGNKPEINEFFRGVIWNDDPACLLFDDGDGHKNENMNYAFGTAWLGRYGDGEDNPGDRTNITGRTHYGDMQWLHSMAMKDGESPKTTLAWILMWLEFTYNIAINAGNNPAMGEQLLNEVAIEGKDADGKTIRLASIADGIGDPNAKTTIKTLFLRDAKGGMPMLERRALGSMLHTIQDSFSKAHVKRYLENEDDILTQNSEKLVFLPGTFGHFTKVMNFHSYGPENEKSHAQWDILGATVINSYDLNSFNRMVGARDAIVHSIAIVNFWVDRAPWADVKKYLTDTVYLFADKPTASVESVD